MRQKFTNELQEWRAIQVGRQLALPVCIPPSPLAQATLLWLLRSLFFLIVDHPPQTTRGPWDRRRRVGDYHRKKMG
jgi:hypothetical protein